MSKNENWQELSKLFQDLQLDDELAGGCLVVYYQGEKVVNTSVGYAQKHTGKNIAWSADTLSLNFSTGKGVLSTLVHCIVSQGLLEYDVPISHYWDEFAHNGKESITLAQVMSHQANLFAIDSIIDDNEMMLDYATMITKVVNMSPKRPAGTNSHQNYTAYSALVYGWVMAGLIEKVTQLSLQEALRKYLTEPLAISDEVYFGMPQNKVNLVAQPARRFDLAISNSVTHNTVNSNAAASKNKASETVNKVKQVRRKPTIKPDSDHILNTYAHLPFYNYWQSMLELVGGQAKKRLETADINRLYFDLTLLNKANYKSALIANAKQNFDYYDSDMLQAVMPAVNGVASANALARIYAMLANHGVFEGQELIKPEVFARLSEIQGTEKDAVLPATMPESMNWRLGYHRVFSLCHDVEDAFGHIGYNGSMAWCDPSRKLAVAFVHNYDTTMFNDVRQFAINESLLYQLDGE